MLGDGLSSRHQDFCLRRFHPCPMSLDSILVQGAQNFPRTAVYAHAFARKAQPEQTGPDGT